MIKLIASDMDGTLLNDEMVISEENAAAIKKAQEAGLHFIIATGRTYESGYNMVQKAGITCPFIALNGARLYDENGGIQYSHEFDHKNLSAALERLKHYDIQIDIVTDQGTYTKLSEEEYIEAVTRDLLAINPSSAPEDLKEEIATYIRELDLVPVDSFAPLLEENAPVSLKLLILNEDRQLLETIRKDIQENLPELIVTSASPRNLEINMRSANKGQAVAEYAAGLGIDADEVVTIGDSLNDVPMLSWATHSFAVENAEPEVKEVARYQTIHHKEHAVAQVINQILNHELNGKKDNNE